VEDTNIRINILRSHGPSRIVKFRAQALATVSPTYIPSRIQCVPCPLLRAGRLKALDLYG